MRGLGEGSLRSRDDFIRRRQVGVSGAEAYNIYARFAQRLRLPLLLCEQKRGQTFESFGEFELHRLAAV